MSRLFVVTRPDLARGFHLAGIDATSVADVETAQEIIGAWLAAGETGLLALDDGLLARMDADFVKRLERAENLPYLLIPGGEPLGLEFSRQARIAELIRRAVGIHISFAGAKHEDET